MVLPLSPETRGHGTHTVATVWKQYLEELLTSSARSVRAIELTANPSKIFTVFPTLSAEFWFAFVKYAK
jgi:hypothetical protein